MRSLILAICFAAATSPVYGLDVWEDTILTASNAPGPDEWIYVHGSASLTIDGPTIRTVELRDSSSLTLAAGEIRANVHFKGTNRFTMTGGVSESATLLRAWPGAETQIELLGGILSHPQAVADLHQGSHRVSVSDQFGTVRMNIAGPNVSVEAVGDYPFYGWDSITQRNFFGVGGGYFYAKEFSIRPRGEYLEGDVTGNGVVDMEDLNAVRNLFGQSTMAGEAWPMDGTVDLADLNRVRNGFGSSVAVPEPSGWAIAVILFSCGFGLTAGLLSDPRKL